MESVCWRELRCPFFEMNENLSKLIGARGSNLTNPQRNQLVKVDGFQFDNCSYESKYEAVHSMMKGIEVARRAAFRLLSLRLGYVERHNTIVRASNHEIDKDLRRGIMSGLVDVAKLPEIKIMGAIVNPLFQSKSRMILAGLCTAEQYDNGFAVLIDRMTRLYEGNDKPSEVLLTPHEFDEHDEVSETVRVSPSAKKAMDEWDYFITFKRRVYMPEVKPVIALGVVTEANQPKEAALIMGPVNKSGKDLPSTVVSNHANFIDKKGYYDIVAFFVHHKEDFPSLYKVVVGQLAPHISTEVDCESLFSQAGHLSDPTRANTKIKTFERLVVAKHRMQRIYCCPKKVQKLYLEREQTSSWNDDGERDDKEFLEIEKKIYLEMFPDNTRVFGEEDGVNDGGEDRDEESL
jgi:hypothetical protein